MQKKKTNYPRKFVFTNQVVYKIVTVKLQNFGFLHTKQKFFSSYSLFIVLLQAEEEVGVRFSTIPRLPATGILHDSILQCYIGYYMDL